MTRALSAFGLPALLIVAAAAAGCRYDNRPADGQQLCAEAGQRCPTGFHCAADFKCWSDRNNSGGMGGNMPDGDRPDLGGADRPDGPPTDAGLDAPANDRSGSGGDAGNNLDVPMSIDARTDLAACATCLAGQRCNAATGACVCDATSCPAGCCDATTGACVLYAGQTAAKCGAAGATCAACAARQACGASGACECTAASCPGGCCQGNTCVLLAGQGPDACGSAGNACGKCALGQTCAAGACSCGGASCSGCCSNGQCNTAPTALACGAGGGMCVACAPNQACTAQGSCACTPASCPNGCCDANGQCRTSAPATCGVGGGTCRVCDPGQQCSAAGACVCNAASCSTGCCSGSTCITTEQPAACGAGGAACMACVSGQRCSGTACVCDATSCPNGCCNGNTCVLFASQSNTACGVGGATCQSCGTGKQCNAAGACVCNAASCPNGCCDATGACVLFANQSNTRCGNGGAACAGCATGVTCNLTGGLCFGCGAPVVITEATASIFTTGTQDRFGAGLAVANGTLLVSAPGLAPNSNNVGGLFAFRGSGTAWTFAQSMVPAGGTTAYAQHVALSSDGLTAAAAGTPGDVVTDFLFSKTGVNWFPAPGSPITPPVDSTSFGYPIAVDGTTLVSGGLFAAYVYATSGGAPQVLAPSDYVPNATNGFFGFDVAIGGGTILVLGEPFDAQQQLGHFVYVFVRSGASWVQQGKLIPSDLPTNSGPAFRISMATDGGSAIIATTFGVYVFTRTGTTWSETQKIVTPAGTNVSPTALSGNLMVLGNANNVGGVGSALVYGRSNGTWIAGPVLSSGASGDSFGAAVAAGSGTVAVGAPNASGNGSVRVYSCSP